MRRQAQAEIMGLIVLVLVLVVALLVYLRFSSISASPAIQEEYEARQFTQTFVSTIIRAEMLACGGDQTEVGILLRALAEDDPGPCASTTALKAALDEVIGTQILPETLTKWGFTYRLRYTVGQTLLSQDPPLLIYESSPPCAAGAERLPVGSQMIPLDGGEAELYLEICI